MAQRTCSIEDCERSHYARDLCGKHYQKWRTAGDPTADHRPVAGVCSIEGCERVHQARGWCDLHYQRWQRKGDPLAVEFIMGDDYRRFWSQVAVTPSCWLWLGHVESNGYGRVQMQGRPVSVHRHAYEQLVGPIPDGLTLDHVHARGCRHTHCVNPAHLEPVTASENTRRRWEASRS